jgi:protein TonB
MRTATARADLSTHVGAATRGTWRLARPTAAVPGPARGRRGVGIGAAVVFHVLLIAALWHLSQVRSVVVQQPPVVARVITLPRAVPPRPPAPPVPRPATKPATRHLPPLVQKPLEVVQAPAQLPAIADAPPLAAMVVSAPSPAAVVAPPPAPAAAIAARPADAPPAPSLTPPRFDADYLRNPPPEYPAFSRRRGEQGRVLLRVHVASDGTPREVEIRASSGSERLDRAALEAVKRWKFAPARLGDRAVDAWVLVPIAFSLDR